MSQLPIRLGIFMALLAVGMGIVFAAAHFRPARPPPGLPPQANLAAHIEPPPADSPLPEPAWTSPAPPGVRIGEIPDDLIARRLTLPVVGVSPNALTPQFYDARGERGHEALDIIAPMGTPVIAVEDGTIAKLFLSNAGGITIYQFDPGQTYAYYYAHLQGYAAGLAEGQSVKRGQVIAYVGMTGNAPTPHLHFAISRLGPDRKWYGGEPLDPYPAFRGR